MYVVSLYSPYSSTLGKAQGTEIFRNMDNFEKVRTYTECTHVHVASGRTWCINVYAYF